MNGLTCAIAGANCRFEAEDLESSLSGATPTLDAAFRQATLIRKAGIADLFATGMPDPFFAALSRGARAYAGSLEKMPEEEKAASQILPFLDAVACEDGQAVGHILAWGRATLNPGREYPEDFLYARFLMGLRAGVPETDLAACLAPWSELLTGEDLRFEVCRALQRRDAEACNRRLSELMEAEAAEWEEREESGALMDEDALTVAKLSVEGLALARLAERLELTMDDVFPLMPSAARIGRLRGARP